MNTTPRRDDSAIIVNPQGAVLLVNDMLPSVPVGPHFWQICEPANHAIHQHYGLTVTTVRCLQADFSEGQETGLYLMEYHEGDLPLNAEWVAPDQLPALQKPVSAQAVQEYVTGFQSGHPLRVAWNYPGYFQRVVASLPDRFPDATVIRVEQLRAWERSWVTRIVTSEGDWYWKAVPPLFDHEPALAAWLSKHDPASVPRLLHMRPGQDFVMTAYSGQPLIERPDVALWGSALSRYAALQVDCVERTGDLCALGVPERGLDWIAAHIHNLLDDDTALRAGVMPLNDDEINRLRALRFRLQKACATLAAFNIPCSLEHGDLWTGQIIAQPDGGFLFTDWSDSAITHPFFSLPFFLAEIHRELPDVPDARERLTNAYLSAWTGFERLEPLREAMACADLLSPFFTALRYHVDILPRMENRWEMENMLSYNLRLLLRAAG